MAIVVYKCDVCKREKEYVRNIEGIEKIQRCTITHGCRGKLFQVNVLDDYVRASASDRVLGLDEWRQRKVLYNHTQTIARDNWIIKHNLGTFPSVSVFVSIPEEGNPDNIEELSPASTIVVDENNTILEFDRPWSGIAQLVARQSDPNLLKPFTRVVNDQSQSLQQVSATGDGFNSEIAIATRITTLGECPEVDLDVEYTTTQNTIVNHTYTAFETIIDTVSTWSDFDIVVIKGKLYTVRSIQTNFDKIDDQTIGSGSTLKITNVSVSACTPSIAKREITQDEIYILFANKPFEIVDKVTTQYVDIFDINRNDFSLLYDSGEYFVQTDVIQTTYPPIRSV